MIDVTKLNFGSKSHGSSQHASKIFLNLVNCSSVNKTTIYNSYGYIKRHPKGVCTLKENKWKIKINVSGNVVSLWKLYFPHSTTHSTPTIEIKKATLRGANRLRKSKKKWRKLREIWFRPWTSFPFIYLFFSMWHESKCQHLEVGGPIPTSSLHIGTQYAKGRGGSRAFNPSIEMKNNPLRSLQARKKSKK